MALNVWCMLIPEKGPQKGATKSFQKSFSKIPHSQGQFFRFDIPFRQKVPVSGDGAPTNWFGALLQKIPGSPKVDSLKIYI